MYVHLNTDILELRVCGRVMVVCCVMCGNVRRGPKKHTSFTDTVQYTTLRAAVYNTAHRGTPQRRTAVHNTAHRGSRYTTLREKKRWPAKKNKKNGMFLAMEKKQEKRI